MADLLFPLLIFFPFFLVLAEEVLSRLELKIDLPWLLGRRERRVNLLCGFGVLRVDGLQAGSFPRIVLLLELLVLLGCLLGSLEMFLAEVRQETIPGFRSEFRVFSKFSFNHEFLRE